MASQTDLLEFDNDQPQTKHHFSNKLLKFRGIFFGTLAALFLALANVFIKSARITTGSEQVFVRFLVQVISIGAFIIISNRSFLGPKESRKLLLMRGSFGTCSILFLHISVKLIDPSDAVALFHLNTIIVSVIARIILKEKVGLAHLTCLIMSMLGVLFIAQPSFIFTKYVNGLVTNYSLEAITSNVSDISHEVNFSSNKSDFNFIIGITLAILAAFTSAFVNVVLKMLSNNKIHFSLPSIYVSYFGLPTGLAISLVMLLTGNTQRDPTLFDSFPSLAMQIFYSLMSASCGMISQIFLQISLKYEESSKIAVIDSTDLLFTYILQYFWLNIITNVYSAIGACLIMFGVFLILVNKIVENKIKKNTQEGNFLKKIFTYKF